MYHLDHLVSLNRDMPALDPIIIDCQGMTNPEVESNLERAVMIIQHRIKSAGLEGDTAIISNTAQHHYGKLPIIIDEAVPTDTIYVLTLHLGGQAVIKPANDLSWEDFIKLIVAGENPTLSISATWAQGKLINIGEL